MLVNANPASRSSPDTGSKPLAVLGATSALACDFIRLGAEQGDNFALFARRPNAVRQFLQANGLPEAWLRGTLADFAASAPGEFSAVLNFIGVGDPAKAKEMGPLILSATLDADKIALDYLKRSPETPYIFMSSGAAYGAAFSQPANDASAALFPINGLTPQDYYGIAKLHAETVHRAATGCTILDIRIFSYVSRHLDLEARFLIADIVRCILRDQILETSCQQLWRDYLHPEDFYALVKACVAAPTGTNRAVDAYSLAPIDKLTLLDLMAKEFGLRYIFTDQEGGIIATGAKPFYYSESRAAESLGYKPTRSSADAIREEVGAVLSLSLQLQ